MSGYILQFLLMALIFLAVGLWALRFDNARHKSVAWAGPAAWIAFIFSAASAIAAGFVAVLGRAGS